MEHGWVGAPVEADNAHQISALVGRNCRCRMLRVVLKPGRPRGQSSTHALACAVPSICCGPVTAIALHPTLLTFSRRSVNAAVQSEVAFRALLL